MEQSVKKFGKELCVSRMRDISHLPNTKFNLFSISKLQNNRWLLFRNKDKIWIKKGEHKVTFDVKIPMPKGAVFAIHVKRENSKEMENMATVSHLPNEKV